jgi:hypothetical protein
VRGGEALDRVPGRGGGWGVYRLETVQGKVVSRNGTAARALGRIIEAASGDKGFGREEDVR